MNPNRGGEQPAPQTEALSLPGPENYGSAEAAPQPVTPETAPARQAAPPVPLPAAPVLPSSDDVTASTSADGQATASAAAPGTAPERIEKQWVEKAKAVIAQTKDDPYQQKNEMTKVKAAYIEKRFNKKLRVDDAVV